MRQAYRGKTTANQFLANINYATTAWGHCIRSREEILDYLRNTIKLSMNNYNEQPKCVYVYDGSAKSPNRVYSLNDCLQVCPTELHTAIVWCSAMSNEQPSNRATSKQTNKRATSKWTNKQRANEQRANKQTSKRATSKWANKQRANEQRATSKWATSKRATAALKRAIQHLIPMEIQVNVQEANTPAPDLACMESPPTRLRRAAAVAGELSRRLHTTRWDTFQNNQSSELLKLLLNFIYSIFQLHFIWSHFKVTQPGGVLRTFTVYTESVLVLLSYLCYVITLSRD